MKRLYILIPLLLILAIVTLSVVALSPPVEAQFTTTQPVAVTMPGLELAQITPVLARGAPVSTQDANSAIGTILLTVIVVGLIGFRLRRTVHNLLNTAFRSLHTGVSARPIQRYQILNCPM